MSCGCIKSRGNSKIKNILQSNQIPFIAEYPVRINDITYYYDFAILNDNKIICFIEYDGVLHFEQDKYHGWNDEKNWKRTRQNDKIKNNYATEKEIPLIRISYFDFNNIDLSFILERINKKCTVDILQL